MKDDFPPIYDTANLFKSLVIWIPIMILVIGLIWVVLR
jgi:hypothetical protein